MSKKFKIGDRVRLASGNIGTVDASHKMESLDGEYMYHIHMEEGSDF